jgi:probable rRNA maturation factor
MSLKFCITYIDVNKVDCKKISNLFTKISKVTNTILKIKPNYLFDVGLVASEFIQKINKEHRHIDKPTDVLSFALHDTNPKTQLLGEIFIN